MPIPDISRPIRVDAKTSFLTPSTANLATVMFTVPANTVYRVRNIMVCNITGAAQVFNAWLTRGSTNFQIFTNVTVPANTTFNGASHATAIYMEPGDQLKVMCGTANGITVTCSYEAVAG